MVGIGHSPFSPQVTYNTHMPILGHSTLMNTDRCIACHYRQSGAITDNSKLTDRRYSMERSKRIGMRFRLTSLLLVLFLALLPTTEACFPGGRLIRRLPKSEPPLVYKQHVPNVPENSMAASGPREGRIRRFSKRYQELVKNWNPDIQFKDEEGTEEDRIMSVRCKEKLDALAMLVMNFWPGVKLRVTESWDQEGIHAQDSLHYEGRAVDITTSDRDRNKYGLLARLAAQAGFDWVYYENRMHVHASVKSDALTRHKRVLKCFPGNATVLTETGHRKSMDKLVIGDRVQVLPFDGHRPVFQPILAFLHRNVSTESEFLELETSSGRHLTASSDHLIFVSNGSRHFVQAKAMARVDIGDFVVVSDTKSMIVSEMVTSIRPAIGRGLYAPLTNSGTIFVDDVLSSCYAAVENERFAHGCLGPLRVWHGILDLFRPSSTWTSWQSDGIHWYAELLLNVAELLERWGVGGILDNV